MDRMTRPDERLARHIPAWSVTRADLAQLRAMRDELAAQVEREDSGGLLPRTWVARFDGR